MKNHIKQSNTEVEELRDIIEISVKILGKIDLLEAQLFTKRGIHINNRKNKRAYVNNLLISIDIDQLEKIKQYHINQLKNLFTWK